MYFFKGFIEELNKFAASLGELRKLENQFAKKLIENDRKRFAIANIWSRVTREAEEMGQHVLHPRHLERFSYEQLAKLDDKLMRRERSLRLTLDTIRSGILQK